MNPGENPRQDVLEYRQSGGGKGMALSANGKRAHVLDTPGLLLHCCFVGIKH
jgi:hypothetical protein